MEREELIRRVKPAIDKVARDAREWAEGVCSDYLIDFAEDLCKQSEIEKTFLVAWLLHLERTKAMGSSYGGSADYFLHAPDSEEEVEVGPFNDPIRQFDVVKAQHKHAPYTVDFVVRRGVGNGKRVFSSPRIAVEIDGHDFHEKTKEQAAHDKERDRILQIDGYVVLRFTGSEVYRDVQKCVDQVEECIDQHITRIELEEIDRIP